MPSALAFDTHASVKRLIQSGMPEAQAEALVEVVSKTADLPDISELATKADLEQLRLATKADLEQLRFGTNADLEQLRLATKADLGQLRADIKADMAGLEGRIVGAEAKASAVKGELIYWIVGASALNALVHFFPHIGK